MKWLRLFLLLLAFISPIGAANCNANFFDEDFIIKEKERHEQQDINNRLIISIAGSVVAIALGVSFIALRRMRNRDDDQNK